MQLVIDEERVIKVDGVALQGLGGLHRPGSGAAPACRAHPPGALAHARRADHPRANAGRSCWSLWAGPAPLRAAAIPGPGHHAAPGGPTPGDRHRDLQAPGRLNADTGPFVEDAVLRAGLETAPWISVDDTGARHQHQNGYCTQVGNDHFAAFTASKSRLNFLEVLRAGYADYMINAEAYMRQRALAGPVIKALASHPDRHFADEAGWRDHLRRLGVTDLET